MLLQVVTAVYMQYVSMPGEMPWTQYSTEGTNKLSVHYVVKYTLEGAYSKSLILFS